MPRRRDVQEAPWHERWRAVLWPLLRLVFPSIRVRSLEIMDVSRTQAMESVQRLFEEALRMIEASGADTNVIFTSNLRRVAIILPGFEKISVSERKYGTTLQGHEGKNPFLLACRLLWVARYIELAGSASPSGPERARRDACFDFVTNFIGRFPDTGEWIEYWERVRLSDLAH